MRVGQRWRGRAARFALCALAPVAVLALALAPAAHAAPRPVPDVTERGRALPLREDGLRTEAATTYRLDPAAGSVDVRVRLSLENVQPDVTVGGAVRQTFLDRFNLLVLEEAEGLAATGAGRSLPIRRTPRPGAPVAVVSIDLQPDLAFGDTQAVELTYRLASRPPRSGGFSRVNPAFVTFPAFTTGDPGAADIEVVVPEGFEVDIVGDPMEEIEVDEGVVYRADDIADPDTFLTNVVARDDDALVAVPVSFGDDELTVLGWPGDDEWAQFVASKVERGVPALEDLIGLPWPGDEDLQVIETASPYLYGYAGWYSPSESLVEVGDALDAAVILHELSHLWFNQQLFAERWINEGLAEVFAALALSRLGDPVSPPAPVDPSDPGRLALVDWSDPDLQEPIADAQEAFGYNAAHVVVDGIAREIGERALSAVVVAAAKRTVAYAGDGKPLRYPGAPGWQELLDLFEEVGGSTTASAAFADLVVSAEGRDDLDDRDAARARYVALADRAAPWSAPRGLRQAMARWDFTAAGDLIDAADEALELRREVARRLAPVGLPLPRALETGYEEALDPGGLVAATAGAPEAATAVAAAVQAERGASGPLVALGVLGASVDDRLRDARSALDDGRYRVAVTEARAVVDAYDGAARAGTLRLAVAALALLGSAFLANAVRARRLRR